MANTEQSWQPHLNLPTHTEIELKLFEQYWVHSRHAEMHRFAFTTVFTAVSVAVIGFISHDNPSVLIKIIFVFALALFSLVGFVVCVKAASLHEAHKKLGDWRLRLLNHGQFVPDVATHAHGSLLAPFFSISMVFTIFYAICFAVSLGFLLALDGKQYPALVALMSLAVLIIVAVRWRRTDAAIKIEPLAEESCEQCASGSSRKYIVWGRRSGKSDDEAQAKKLLLQLLNNEHPVHTSRAITLQDLRDWEFGGTDDAAIGHRSTTLNGGDMREHAPAGPKSPNEVIRATNLQGILSFHMYQDGLMWSRVQTLGVLQAGIVAAQYGLRNSSPFLEWFLGITGMVLTLTLLNLVIVDERFRDINLPMMRAAFEEFGERAPRLTENGSGWGGWSLRIIIVLFAVLDLVFAVVFTHWDKFAAVNPCGS